MTTNSKTPEEKEPILSEDSLSAYLEQDISWLCRTVFFYLSNEEAPGTIEMQIVHKVIKHIKSLLDQRLVVHIEILGYVLKRYDIYHRKQCILLVGKETEIALIEGIVSYMFYVLQNSEIRDLAAGKDLKWRGITLVDLSYMDEQETGKKLFSTKCMFSEEARRYSRGLLFLRNLNCGYKRLLKRLVHVIRTDYMPGTGIIFVVSTDKAENLPREFLALFEIIRLVPKEQSKALDTPQAKNEVSFIPLPPPAGTQWHDVAIAFIDKESVSIKIKDKDKAVTKSYAEMGFKGRSTIKEEGKASVLWVTLRTLARSDGVCAGYQNVMANKIKEDMSDLRKKLTSYFNIEGDPIPYKKGVGYKTAFKLQDRSYSEEHENSSREQHKGYEQSGTENPCEDDDLA